jgi:hypothetical protein
MSTSTAAPYVYTLNTTSLANGSYTLSAKAYDVNGTAWISNSVVVTVANDASPPAVSLTSPSSGATVGGKVMISANASDNVGVSRVEFYVNGLLMCTSTSAPYSFDWDSTSAVNGSACTLSARAYDTAGNVGQSAQVTVTVVQPPASQATAVPGLSPVGILVAVLCLTVISGMLRFSAPKVS